MEFRFNRNLGLLCAALFLILFGLTFFAVPVPAVLLGILAIAAGILLIVTG